MPHSSHAEDAHVKLLASVKALALGDNDVCFDIKFCGICEYLMSVAQLTTSPRARSHSRPFASPTVSLTSPPPRLFPLPPLKSRHPPGHTDVTFIKNELGNNPTYPLTPGRAEPLSTSP